MTACTCDGNPTGIYLCRTCQTTLAYALMAVADFTDDLANIAAKQVRYSTNGKASVGKTVPAPIDLRFSSRTEDGSRLADEARATVVAWARTLMDEQTEVQGAHCGKPCLHTSCNTIRVRRWPADTVRSMCLYLDRGHRWIEGREWAPVLLDEMCNLERRLRRFVNPPEPRWPAGKCECGADMYAQPGALIVKCWSCGEGWDARARRDYLVMQAAEELVTATVAAAALTAWTEYDGSPEKLVKRISAWRDEGRLEVSDVTRLSGRDRHLYRFGDIQTLVVAHIQRRQRVTLTGS